MPRLVDVTSMIRSKNAGPFWLTIDVIFRDADDYRRWADDEQLSAASIATRYGRRQDEIHRHDLPAAFALKFSFARRHPSGSPLDSDVFGCQQHAPVAEIELSSVTTI
jgi:hypothetical protein